MAVLLDDDFRSYRLPRGVGQGDNVLELATATVVVQGALRCSAPTFADSAILSDLEVPR